MTYVLQEPEDQVLGTTKHTRLSVSHDVSDGAKRAARGAARTIGCVMIFFTRVAMMMVVLLCCVARARQGPTERARAGSARRHLEPHRRRCSERQQRHEPRGRGGGEDGRGREQQRREHEGATRREADAAPGCGRRTSEWFVCHPAHTRAYDEMLWGRFVFACQ